MTSAADRVVDYVKTNEGPVRARDVAAALDLPAESTHAYLSKKVNEGELIRVSRGFYDAADTQGFVVSGDTGLPVADDRDREWDGDDAAVSVFAFFSDDDGGVDVEGVGKAFLWRVPDTDGTAMAHWKLGFVDVVDGRLTIIPRGVSAAAGALAGARGGVDVPEDDRGALEARVCALYDTVQAVHEDFPDCPFSDQDDDDEEGDDMSDGEAVAASGQGEAEFEAEEPGDEPTEAIEVEGPVVIEGQITGDGRLIEAGALEWGDGPWPIIFDRTDGDHTGETVGAITGLERRGDVIWASGELSASTDPEAAASVARAAELLAEGAVGVSIMLDSEHVELRVDRDAVDIEVPDPDGDMEEASDGRLVVARYRYDQAIEVVTSGRIRHVAIVDTPAFADASLGLVASVMVAAEADWFNDPGFADDPRSDPRLRYDPHRRRWSAPFTVEANGRVYGHLAPDSVCLVGGQGCTMPPEGLGGFMRFAAPAAGGRRTGPIVLGTTHAPRSATVEEANAHLSNSGRAVADVCVGRDRYGAWVAGAVRPGATEADRYALAASGISGEWRSINGRLELTAIVAVNAEGFPKGWMTAEQVAEAGLVASVAPDDASAACEVCATDGDCGCNDDDVAIAQTARIDQLESVVAELLAWKIQTELGGS